MNRPATGHRNQWSPGNVAVDAALEVSAYGRTFVRRAIEVLLTTGVLIVLFV
jgi:hypothetical protein